MSLTRFVRVEMLDWRLEYSDFAYFYVLQCFLWLNSHNYILPGSFNTMICLLKLLKSLKYTKVHL
jgi:hypothetical protein